VRSVVKGADLGEGVDRDEESLEVKFFTKVLKVLS
jgi:hypothetical protein